MGDFFAGMDQADGGGKVFRYNGSIYRYEGDATWTCVVKDPHCITQIHCMAEIGGQLWIGTWPQGYVPRLEASGAWTTTGRLGIPKGLFECNEVMDLRVYNGKFYATLILKS